MVALALEVQPASRPLLFPGSQVLKGQVDFASEPWPHISAAAKDCVQSLLTMDASKRLTSKQVGGAACRAFSAGQAAGCRSH